MTMDHRPDRYVQHEPAYSRPTLTLGFFDRLNVHLDEQDVVKDVNFG